MAEALAPLHGSAFSYEGAGCLLLGPSGSGKSYLTAQALAHGAKLIADDQVRIVPMLDFLTVQPVAELEHVLELRGIGLVRMNDTRTKQLLHLVVELEEGEPERLPEQQTREFAGIAVPYLRLPPVPQTGVAPLLIYLKALQEGRVLPTDWRPERHSAQ